MFDFAGGKEESIHPWPTTETYLPRLSGRLHSRNSAHDNHRLRSNENERTFGVGRTVSTNTRADMELRLEVDTDSLTLR